MIGMSRGPLGHGPKSMVTTRRRRPNDSKQNPSQHFDVEFSSVLRIRPLLKNKEKEDYVVLQKARQPNQKVSVAVLHPPLYVASPSGGRNVDSPSNFIHEAREEDFHFDKVLDTGASQETCFYAIGLSMASTAMEPLKKNAATKTMSSVVIGMGVKDSGKTHTLFGKIKAGTSQEGLVPRVIDSLFSQSKHHISSSKSFGIRLTILQVENDVILKDLLVEARKQGTPNKGTKASVMAMVASFEKPVDSINALSITPQITIEQDAETSDFVAKNASHKICTSAKDARELIVAALTRGQTSRLVSFGGRTGARGHILVSIQPVLIGRSNDIECYGGTICMVDLAAMEPKAKKKSRSGQMKDSISADSTLAALMHCFRTIKHNKQILEGHADELDIVCEDDVSVDGSDISCVSDPKSRGPHSGSLKTIPWRQSKVTMLLQPLFTTNGDSHGHDGTTKVSFLMAAYPGHRDYAEKRSILKDLEILHGHHVGRTLQRHVETGVHSIPDRDLSLTYSTSEEEVDQYQEVQKTKPPPKRLKSTPPTKHRPQPSAPSATESLNDPQYQLERLSLESEPSAAPLYVNDFPGVTQPTPTAVLRKDNHFVSPPMMNPSFNDKSTEKNTIAAKAPIRALVPSISKANIQPPVNKSPQQKTGWSLSSAVTAGVSGMASTPVKSLTTAVNAGVSAVGAGKRHIESMTKTAAAPSPGIGKSRNGLTRMASEYEISNDACQEALRRRVAELEVQNSRLVERNRKLDERCGRLQNDKETLAAQLRESGRQSRQKRWTDQDEAEFRNSRKMRLKEQTLIHSPLQKHLQNVEATYQIGHKWLDSGKSHFDLRFPKWWQGVQELNERDAAIMEEDATENRFATPNGKGTFQT